MKLSKSIYAGCVTAILLSSMTACNKLDEYNPSGATADAAWSTPQGFVTLVNAAYNEQRNWYGKEDGIFMGESGTDLWYNRETNGYARQLTQYDGLTPLQGNPNRNTWEYLWRGVNLCNAGIGRINEAGFSDANEKNRREGELRFLRAFYYWHIVETWGGVMLRTEETREPELTATRSSVDDFYKLIISDLEFAAANLPTQAFWGNEYSRASNKSALGFLARAYLSRAYYSLAAGNTTEANGFFTKAKDVAKDVINRKGELGVDLWSNPADLWNPANNKRNKEALYTISISTNPGINIEDNANRVFMTFQSPYTGSNRPGLVNSLAYGYDNERRLMPTLSLLNYFDETKDARYAASFQEVWIANAPQNFTWTAADVTRLSKNASITGQVMVSGRDTALLITKKVVPNKDRKPYIVVDRNDMYDARGAIKTGTRDFVTLKKFMDPFRSDPVSKVGTRDIIVMRLAEMYLIAAEAEFQLDNPQGAADMLNVLRTRAALPGKVADMQVTAANVTNGGIDFILEERARELCGEYIRWFDLKRTKYENNGEAFKTFITTRNPNITLVEGFHRLRPIKQEEINALLNGQEFGQNPGYN
ncbi:RagB/SusD family nutrient uptake outer membrane protein [Pedobacter sp. SYSU D00535]|uniref:RagB/SusD family nutrient uptake outer membrane protein n=1 Tax=Pedobacter sp. SYSU D00535 TaxID=2810308 RepID=UPI001A9748B7|nr:RagB/SusD family nutrient uptake outer membrane protein [Pedobacter sp. SYSU D00535]